MKRLFGSVKRLNTEKNYIKPTVLVHGGAGYIADKIVGDKKQGVKIAAFIGYDVLLDGGTVLDAVHEAVRIMELNPRFSARHDSVLMIDGTVEMNASIMSGCDLNCGAISGVTNVCHPISLARLVMEKTNHKYLDGNGAMRFALEQGINISPEDRLILSDSLLNYDDYRNRISFEYGSKETVGAVAIDKYGNVAAATTDGGADKITGGTGDTPIVGSITYADNLNGAVSVTGHRETIMQYNAASRILARIQFQEMSANEATRVVLENMGKRFKKDSGAICIDANGEIGIHFTAERMPWAYRQEDELHCGVDREEDEVSFLNYSYDD